MGDAIHTAARIAEEIARNGPHVVVSGGKAGVRPLPLRDLPEVAPEALVGVYGPETTVAQLSEDIAWWLRHG